MIMIAFVRRILFVSPRAADGNHFTITKASVPYIQKVGKMGEKQENSTLMENNRNEQKTQERLKNADDSREIGRLTGKTRIEI